jgi:hypothetical protein
MYQPWSYKNLLLAIISLVAGAFTGTIAVLVFAHSPPLTTHRLVVPLNSGVATVPVALKGVSELPKLLSRDSAQQHWAIVGGALLQMGFSRLSIPALERAIANDEDNRMLHVALGEALTIVNGGRISDRAKVEFDVALRGDPNDLIARFYMAYWLLQNGKPKPALVKWVGLMRTVGRDQIWYDRLWAAMPLAAEKVGVDRLTLEALCVAGM